MDEATFSLLHRLLNKVEDGVDGVVLLVENLNRF